MIRLAVRCRADEAGSAEAALSALLEVAPAGVEQVDEPDGRHGFVEYAIYGAPGELPDLGSLRAAVGGALVEVRSEPFPDDWRERWKRFYHPLLIGGCLYVRPPWERPAERGGVVEVVIDPGAAFGTGTHPTTAMCLELLVEGSPRHGVLRRLLGAEKRSLCDIGCGSGILAIAAAKLRFEPVVAADVEIAALDETRRNARRNYVELDVRRLDVRREPAPLADVVTANLTLGLLEALAGRWATAGERPAKLIVSGLLRSETERACHAFEYLGLERERQLERGEWAALAMVG